METTANSHPIVLKIYAIISGRHNIILLLSHRYF